MRFCINSCHALVCFLGGMEAVSATDPLPLIPLAQKLLSSLKLNELHRENPFFFRPDNPAIRLVGRFDSAQDFYGNSVKRFDMNGCEIQFQVEGAKEVTVYLEQRISGPRGWFHKHPHQLVMNRKRLRLAESLAEQTASVLQTDETEEDFAEDADETEEDLSDGDSLVTRMEMAGSQPHEFLVFVDGEPQLQPIDGSECRACTFDTRNAESLGVLKFKVASKLGPGPHEIRIFKISEPEWSSPRPVPNWLSFHGVELDAGQVREPSAPRPSRRVEFMGDSVSSGYCNLCTDNKEDVKRQGSYAVAWPAIACAVLGAECHHLAMAGYGLACNCCGECSTDVRLPHIWERTIATDDRSAWEPGAWVPSAVVINAGDNDHVWDPRRNQTAYVSEYTSLLTKMSAAYGLGTHFFLGCGPRGFRLDQDDDLCALVQQVVGNTVQLGVKAHFLDQRGYMNGTFGKPCCGHPSIPIGQAMAKDAATMVARTLGWDL